MVKILLVQPPARQIINEEIVVPPLGLSYIAAVLEQHNYQVKILDAFALRMTWTEFESAVKQEKADIIGLTGMTPVIDVTYRAANICRKFCKYLVAGGPHVTVFIKDIFNQISELDFAIFGEGEYTFLELVKALDKNGNIYNLNGLATREYLGKPQDLVNNLDSLPFPARDLLPNNFYHYPFTRRGRITTLFTSRGCPYQCIFCDKSIFGSKWRARSAKNVLDELEEITKKFHIHSVVIYDDIFTLDRNRVIKICKGIIERKINIDWKCEARPDAVDGDMLKEMKRAGCSMIAYGVESANPKGLNFLNKGYGLYQIKQAFKITQKVGIRAFAYFILGIPPETYEDEIETIEFAKSLKPDYVQFSILSPFAGTKLYRDAVQTGTYREIDARNPVDKDLKRAVVISDNWDEEKFRKILYEAYKRFYLGPGYLIKRLLCVHSQKELFKLFKWGLRIVYWVSKGRLQLLFRYGSLTNQTVLGQRQQYLKGGIGRMYWDYRDRQLMRYIKGETILDIGCGEGITLEKIIRRFPEKNIKGIDNSQENVVICRKYNLPVERGDVYKLNFKDNFVDTCILSEVIEHLNDYARALKEIYRVLKKDGLLILLFPNDRNFKISRILTGKFKEAFYNAGHVRQWTPFYLNKELIKIGFEVVDIKNIPFYFWLISLHSLIIAKKL